MAKKCYCPVCQMEKEFVVVENRAHYEENGINFEFDEKVAKCCDCKEELFMEEINEINQKTYEQAYRKAASTITNDEINEIITKYRISKRNLSLVLGLGELTITRYLDGYIPIKKNSILLKEVLNSPEIYLDYLNKNKDLINDLLNINENDQLIEDVAEYIIKNNDETTNLVLQKLLYYTEVFYMLFFKKKLFKSTCSAWEHGPVYGRIYYEFKDFGREPIDKDIDVTNIDNELRKLIDEIIKDFGVYSGKVLAHFTHQESPWKYARENNLTTIDDNLIKELAENIKEKYSIVTYSDIRKYSDSRINDYNQI